MVNKYTIVFLFAGYLVGHTILHAAPPAESKAATQSHSTHKMQPELGATIAVDNQQKIWTTYKQADGNIVVRHSTNLGKTWSAPTTVATSTEKAAANGEQTPKITLGPQGQIYVSWTRPLAKPYTGEIRFSRSLDGGKTFSVPMTVHKDQQEITHRFESMVVLPNGSIVLAWIDKRDLEERKSQQKAYRGAAVYAAISDDQGATFRGDYKIADHSCECCRLALQADADNRTFIFWRHVFEPNIRDHALAQLNLDGTISNIQRATFDDWKIDACPHHGPGLAQDGAGNLHAVWFSMAPGKEGIFYGRLAPLATQAAPTQTTQSTHPEFVRSIGGPTAQHADIAAIDNRVAIVWKAFDGQHTVLYALLSENSGKTWKESVVGKVSSASDHPRLVKYKKDFYAFWNTQDKPLQLFKIE